MKKHNHTFLVKLCFAWCLSLEKTNKFAYRAMSSELLRIYSPFEIRHWSKDAQCSETSRPLTRAAGRLQSSPIHFHSVLSFYLFQQ